MTAAQGTTWHVSPDGTQDFVSIQPAVIAAQIGDTVLVGPGTYLENIRFAGRDIILKSSGGPHLTTLDGSKQPRAVVEFRSGESNACKLEGFRITGGTGSGVFEGERNGGGVWIQDAEPTIVANVIEYNEALAGSIVGLGGGIYCRASLPDDEAPLRSPKIIGNTIRFNVAMANGGGIGLQEKVTAEILNNEISDNRTVRGDGGGIWIVARHHPEIRIEGNRIEQNDASDHGGGIYAGNSFHGTAPPMVILIRRNIIARNLARARALAEDSGGGVWLLCTNATVVENTIVANQGQGPANGFGGGISFQELGHPLLERNIIALTVQGGGILCHDNAQPTIRNNLLWANEGGDARGSCVDWDPGDGNFASDPLFCDAANGDYRVPSNSPALSLSAGVVGALSEPGCPVGINVVPRTWTEIKLGRSW